MKIYIVEYSDWDEHANFGVFSTQELAEEHLKKISKGHSRGNYYVSEYEVDNPD